MFRLEDLLEITELNRGINHPKALRVGVRLIDSPYVIEELLFRSELYFVYLGVQTITGQHIIIKEFYPVHKFSYEGVSIELDRKGTKVCVVSEDESSEHAFNRLKQVNKKDGDCLKKLRKLRNVINILETMYDNNTSYKIFEYLPFPDLKTLLKKKLLKPKEAIKLFEMILHSVKQVHDQGYVIRNLSVNNIFISDRHVILGDFHIARNYENLYYDTSHRKYEAPEVKNHEPIGRTSDIYSLGMILYNLMEHIGYSFDMDQKALGSDFKSEKIDYLLNKMLVLSPDERIQTVDEVLDIFKEEPEPLPDRSKIYKTFIALVLCLIALVTIMKSDLIEYFFPHDELVAEEKQMSFSFTRLKEKYDFGEHIIIEWEDTSVQPYYNVLLKYKQEAFKFRVEEPKINLDYLCLNPEEYYIEITDSSGDVLNELFTIESLENPVDHKPIMLFEAYAFYEDEFMEVAWSNDANANTRVMITDLCSLELVSNKLMKSTSDVLNLNQGNYLISIQSIEDQNTYYDHALVLIVSNDDVKPPIVYTRTNDDIKCDGNLEWIPTDGTVTVKFLHDYEDSLTVKVDASEGYIDLKDYHLETGRYLVVFSLLKDNRSSTLVRRYVNIVE